MHMRLVARGLQTCSSSGVKQEVGISLAVTQNTPKPSSEPSQSSYRFVLQAGSQCGDIVSAELLPAAACHMAGASCALCCSCSGRAKPDAKSWPAASSEP